MIPEPDRVCEFLRETAAEDELPRFRELAKRDVMQKTPGGDQVTIADYLGAAFVTLGEIVRCDFSPYPNVQRWLGNMRKLKSWPKVDDVFEGYKASVKDQAFAAL